MPTDIDALVMDVKAAELMSRATIESAWFDNLSLPSGQPNLRKAVVGRTVYILSTESNEDSKLLIINMRSDGGAGDAQNPERVLQRILRVTLTMYNRSSVSIPRHFKPFRDGSLSSYMAYNANEQDTSRIYFRLDNDNHLFMYAMSNRIVNDIRDIDIPRTIYNAAVNAFADALLNVMGSENLDSPNNSSAYNIVFDDLIGRSYSAIGTSLSDWLNSKLTLQQLKFVQAPLNRPIRLHGSAGTGKTQSMVIKCIKELFEAEDEKKDTRIGFITHSSGVAHEVVEGMMWSLDPQGQRNKLSHAHLWVGSLYELAKEKLSYVTKHIAPLSDDGVEAREEQREWLELFVGDCKREPYFANTLLPGCSESVREGLEAEPIDPLFLLELANEIDYLDSERIKKSDADKSKEYLTGDRRDWQMDLPEEPDRRAVLEIHDKYIRRLGESNIISLDQMIADFLDYLNTYEWSNFKKKDEGFDAIFIDELHCFNNYERSIFHLLIRGQAVQNGLVPLFMAYDLKQSTSDRFLSSAGGPGRFFQTIRAGRSEKVELTKVFRSTPQISKFLQHIDGAFPAYDLEGEWNAYGGDSQQAGGSTPTLRLYKDETSMVDDIVGEAYRFAKSGGGKNVAVLDMSESRFLVYAKAGRIADQISAIESNADLAEIRYAKRRCIFSMPDNVAGLQFERVYLIHVDKYELDANGMSAGAQRRLLSRLYLGASRASRHLTLAASQDRGGQSEVLQNALDGSGLEIYRKL